MILSNPENNRGARLIRNKASIGEYIMKKPLRKRNIRSSHHAIKALLNHPAQCPTGEYEDKTADPLETRIAQFMAAAVQKKQTQTDGYWSVLREL